MARSWFLGAPFGYHCLVIFPWCLPRQVDIKDSVIKIHSKSIMITLAGPHNWVHEAVFGCKEAGLKLDVTTWVPRLVQSVNP